MNTRTKAARWLVGVGSLLLFGGGFLHLFGGYPLVKAGVLSSNLDAALKSALRSVFLMVGWHWIVLAVIATLAAFSRAPVAKLLVLLCGFTLLVDGALMATFLGWFVGTNMILFSALLILCGGFALEPATRALATVTG